MLELVKMRDNQYLHVDVLGTGKKVVVLLHGIGGSSTMWIPFCLPHLKDYKFVIPNLRGFGKSGHLTFTTPNIIWINNQKKNEFPVEIIDNQFCPTSTVGGRKNGRGSWNNLKIKEKMWARENWDQTPPLVTLFYEENKLSPKIFFYNFFWFFCISDLIAN